MPKPAEEPERFTYADALRWPEDERWELHEGVSADRRSARPRASSPRACSRS
ncbi:hypothetical protein [Enhygromyxa salina]|uniref:hypothetical protein n=1 Tax=Enhygromyxa salina TaxID=215803 RepID=UPI0015E5E071|nr:hypothetical protein [Enhygromyxa salina]